MSTHTQEWSFQWRILRRVNKEADKEWARRPWKPQEMVGEIPKYDPDKIPEWRKNQTFIQRILSKIPL